jgi:tetratricopeptide (TPR) repeat protein
MLSDFVSNKEYQDYILVPIVVVLSVACFWYVNVPGIRANKDLIGGMTLIQKGKLTDGMQLLKGALAYNSMGTSEIREQLISFTPSVIRASQFDQQAKKDFVTLTFNEVDKQIAMVPNDARYYILMGSLLNSIGDPEQALSYIKKAIELSPRKQVMRFELIQSLYILGRSAEAMAEAKAAYELDTRYDQAKQVYKTTIENEIKVNPKFKTEGEKILKDLNIR